MKKNFKVMTVLASAALLLTACSSDKLEATSQAVNNPASADNSIQFGTYMGRTATTRANAVTEKTYDAGPIANTVDDDNKVNSLAQARFGVFSYLTSSDYDRITPTELRPNFMYNQELIWSTADPANMWIYTPVKYWPNGIDAANADNDPSNTAVEKTTQKLSFFAYAPYMKEEDFTADYDGTFPDALGAATDARKVATPTNGIVAMTKNTFTKNVWLKYMLPNVSETNAVDLLWGVRGAFQYSETDGTNNPSTALTGLDENQYNVNLTKQTVDERVKFLFKHALAKIGGNTQDGTKSTTTAASTNKTGMFVKVDVDNNYGSNQTDYFAVDFDNTKTLVTIKSVKIQDGKTAGDDANNAVSDAEESDIYKDGWFNIEQGIWELLAKGATVDINIQNDATADDPTNDIYTLNPKIKEVGVKNATGTYNQDWNPAATDTENGYTGGAEGVEVDAKPLFSNEYVPGLMLIPGTEDQTIYVTVDYIVRTTDANLSTGYSEVEQVITNKVTLPAAQLKSNNMYKLVMHLGLTSVKFEAVVSDWQSKNGSNLDEEGHETGGDVNNDRNIWLPSNVVSASTSATLATGSEAKVHVAHNLGTYNIYLTGLTAGNTVSVKSKTGDGISGATATPSYTSGTAVQADGKATVAITGITANSTSSAVENVITIEEKDSSNNVVSTTKVTIVQAANS